MDLKKLLVINGPNLNVLGKREPHIYGERTYQDLCKFIEDYCREKDIYVEIFQSNHEGDIVDVLQKAYGRFQGIIINPAAYTHSSIAILDALQAVGLPTVEVHLSDILQREDFRQISYIRDYCLKSVIGLGFDGYIEAIDFLLEYDIENNGI